MKGFSDAMSRRPGAGKTGPQNQPDTSVASTPAATYPFSREDLIAFLAAVDAFTGAVFAFMLPYDLEALLEAAQNAHPRRHGRILKRGDDGASTALSPAVTYPFSPEELIDFVVAVDDLMAAIFQFIDTLPDGDALLDEVLKKGADLRCSDEAQNTGKAAQQ